MMIQTMSFFSRKGGPSNNAKLLSNYAQDNTPDNDLGTTKRIQSNGKANKFSRNYLTKVEL